jgi:hypothetical protein
LRGHADQQLLGAPLEPAEQELVLQAAKPAAERLKEHR